MEAEADQCDSQPNMISASRSMYSGQQPGMPLSMLWRCTYCKNIAICDALLYNAMIAVFKLAFLSQ